MKLQRLKSRWHGGFEEADCPIAVLEPRVEPLVHLSDGFAITYRKFSRAFACGRHHAGRVHAHARTPACRHGQLDEPARTSRRSRGSESIVRDRSQSPELIDADRELMVSSLKQPSRGPSSTAARYEQLLHGEPHARQPAEIRRAACGSLFSSRVSCGPVEFDLAHAPEEVERPLPGLRRSTALLRDCRISCSRWCCVATDRDADFPNGARSVMRCSARYGKHLSATDCVLFPNRGWGGVPRSHRRLDSTSLPSNPGRSAVQAFANTGPGEC